VTDWADMTRQDYDVNAPPTPLFELTPASVPAPDDGHGTGDLLELLDD
jgi:hypothetical protein